MKKQPCAGCGRHGWTGYLQLCRSCVTADAVFFPCLAAQDPARANRIRLYRARAERRLPIFTLSPSIAS